MKVNRNITGNGTGFPPVRCSTAFTLIELILAVGVAAIVLISINAVFFSALHLRDATTEAVDEATPVEQMFSIMRRDLQCAVPPKPNGILSGSFKAGSVATIGLADTVSTEMYTATGALHEAEPDRKSTRLNSSHERLSRMPSSA